MMIDIGISLRNDELHWSELSWQIDYKWNKDRPTVGH